MSERQNNKVIDIILPALCAAVITACSWISIPAAVPFTLQTFAIFLVTSIFGAKCGFLSIVVYIMTGIIGLPVFSGFNSGISAIAGPTGGYILGFLFIPICYMFFTKLFSKTVLAEFLGNAAGLSLCYFVGTVWFIIIYNRTENIGILKTLSLCVIPFIIPDIIKLSVAIFVSKRLRPIIEKIK